MTNRRAITLLSLIGLLIAVYLLMHRMGYIGTLACGTGGCETVQASRFATFARVPVPAWGVLGYGLLFAVALASLSERWGATPMIAGALLGLATIAFVFSLYLTALEALVIHAWCRWCVTSATIATLIFIASLAELPRLREGTTYGGGTR